MLDYNYNILLLLSKVPRIKLLLLPFIITIDTPVQNIP